MLKVAGVVEAQNAVFKMVQPVSAYAPLYADGVDILKLTCRIPHYAGERSIINRAETDIWTKGDIRHLVH